MFTCLTSGLGLGVSHPDFFLARNALLCLLLNDNGFFTCLKRCYSLAVLIQILDEGYKIELEPR